MATMQQQQRHAIGSKDVRIQLLALANSSWSTHSLELKDDHDWLRSFISNISSSAYAVAATSSSDARSTAALPATALASRVKKTMVAELMKTPGKSRPAVLGLSSKKPSHNGVAALLFAPPSGSAPAAATSGGRGLGSPASSRSNRVSPGKSTSTDKENSHANNNKKQQEDRSLSPRKIISSLTRSDATTSLARRDSPRSVRAAPVGSAALLQSRIDEREDKIVNQLASGFPTSSSHASVPSTAIVADQPETNQMSMDALVVVAPIAAEEAEEQVEVDQNSLRTSLVSTVIDGGELSMIGEEEEAEDDGVEGKNDDAKAVNALKTNLPTTSASATFADADEDIHIPLNDDPSHPLFAASTSSFNTSSSSTAADDSTTRTPHAATRLAFNSSAPTTANSLIAPPSISSNNALSANLFRPSAGGGVKLNFIGLPSYREREREQSAGMALKRSGIWGAASTSSALVVDDQQAVVGLGSKRKSEAKDDEAKKASRRSVEGSTASALLTVASIVAAPVVVADQTTKDRIGSLKSRLQTLSARTSTLPSSVARPTPFAPTSTLSSVLSLSMPTPASVPAPAAAAAATVVPTIAAAAAVVSPRRIPVPIQRPETPLRTLLSPIAMHQSTTPRSAPSIPLHPERSVMRASSVVALVHSFEMNPDQRIPTPSKHAPLSPRVEKDASSSKLTVDDGIADGGLVREVQEASMVVKSTTPAQSPPTSRVKSAIVAPHITAVTSPVNAELDVGRDEIMDVEDDEEREKEKRMDEEEAMLPALPSGEDSIIALIDDEQECEAEAIIVERGREGLASALDIGRFSFEGEEGKMIVENQTIVEVERIRVVKASPVRITLGANGEVQTTNDERMIPVSSSSIHTSTTVQSKSLFGAVTAAAAKPLASIFGKKGKFEVKSLASAAAAKERAREEEDRKAIAKEDRERRRALATAKIEEDRKRDDDERRERERKFRKSASIVSVPKSRVGAVGGGTVARMKTKIDANESAQSLEMNKKRKMEEGSGALKSSSYSTSSTSASTMAGRPEIKKPREMKDPPSRPPSAQSNYSAAGSYRPGSALSNSSNSHLKSSTTSNQPTNAASSSSSMIGGKFDQNRLTAGQPGRATGPIKSSMKKTVIAAIAVPPVQIVVEQDEYVELPDIDSEYSDSGDEDHDKKSKALPPWAQSPAIAQALQMQQHLNPDTIFGTIPKLEMEQIFRTKSSRISKRTSSAVWEGTDALTESEKQRYNRQMGYASIGNASSRGASGSGYR